MRKLVFFYIPLLLFMMTSCEISPLIAEIDGYAGRFVKIRVMRFSSNSTEYEISHLGKVIAHGTVEGLSATIEFFAPSPGRYELWIDGDVRAFDVPPPRWSVLVWMVADNDLHPFVEEDLQEMEKAAEDVSVIVALDAASDSILALSRSGFKVVKEVSMNGGNGEELREFMENYGIPSVKTFLIIWDHGAAWLKDFRYSTKAVGFDEGSKDALTISELAESIPFEVNVIGFDACFMGSIEVAYELRRKALYMVASGDYEPGSGWNYSFLEDISNLDPRGAAEKVVDAYASAYSDLKMPLSLAVLDLLKTDDLASSLREYVKVVPLEDLKELARELRDDDEYRRFLKDASKVLSLYEPSLKEFEELVVHGWGSAQLVNIFLPNPGLLDNAIADYETLSFGSETGWTELLREAGL